MIEIIKRLDTVIIFIGFPIIICLLGDRYSPSNRARRKLIRKLKSELIQLESLINLEFNTIRHLADNKTNLNYDNIYLDSGVTSTTNSNNTDLTLTLYEDSIRNLGDAISKLKKNPLSNTATSMLCSTLVLRIKFYRLQKKAFMIDSSQNGKYVAPSDNFIREYSSVISTIKDIRKVLSIKL